MTPPRTEGGSLITLVTMPRIPLVVLALALALAAPGARAAAQQGEETTLVTGVVTDTLSGRPLHVAVVRVAETGASTLTDESGRYQIRVAPGTVRLDVRRIGYAPASVTLQTTGHWMGYHIYLHPLAIGLAPVTVTARDEFDNFHVRVEYKWGTKRWPPRANC